MKSKLLGALALLFLLSSFEIAAAQDLASQMVGVWKRTSYVRKIVDGGDTTKPYGESPGGIATFTRGGHFTVTLLAEGRKGPVGTPPTDTELAELFRTLFFGSGTYKIDGDKVVVRYDSSSLPAWVGAERRITLVVSGNGKALTWTTPEFKDAAGKAYIDTITHERLE